jgi:zinc protease
MRGGVLEEPEDEAGALKLLASTWTRGSGNLGPQELARRVENMAGRLFAYSGRNSFGLAGEFLSRFQAEGLDLFGQVLADPSFEPGEVAKRKMDQLAAIKARDEQMPAVAFRLLAQTIYQGHPYARDPLGTQNSVTDITAADLKGLFNHLVRTENLVIAVAGDVSTQEIIDRLNRMLEPLTGSFKPTRPDRLTPLPPEGIRVEDLRPGLNQTQTLLGFRAPGLGHPDSQALELLAAALSSQSGRLFVELRDKKSLAYALAAVYQPGLDLGSFVFYLASAPEKVDQVRLELLSQVDEIRSRPLSAVEFNRARAKLLSEMVLNRQRFDDRAMDLALYERLGLGFDYLNRSADEIKSLTPERVLGAARRWLDPDRPVWIIVGPEL